MLRTEPVLDFSLRERTLRPGTSSQRCGYDMVMIKIYSQPVTTSNINQLDWVIPVTARQPEAAMKFMNLMYTNADVVNLLNYGIEGARLYCQRRWNIGLS